MYYKIFTWKSEKKKAETSSQRENNNPAQIS